MIKPSPLKKLSKWYQGQLRVWEFESNEAVKRNRLEEWGGMVVCGRFYCYIKHHEIYGFRCGSLKANYAGLYRLPVMGEDGGVLFKCHSHSRCHYELVFADSSNNPTGGL